MLQKIDTIKEIRKTIYEWKKLGYTIGFVPTMGYLHDGHKSLIDRAVLENDKVVVSIFLNPTQFSQNEDLDSYPKDIINDTKICEQAGADLIFLPTTNEIYPAGFSTYVTMDKGASEGLCGSSRLGHFNGVCTVVAKLFAVVKPNNAYFGQKDAQQLAVIKQMVRDLNIDINIVGCKIVREADGLAMSSRNSYLNADERVAALSLSKALTHSKNLVDAGLTDVEKIKFEVEKIISQEPLAKIDYVEIVDTIYLKPIKEISSVSMCVIAVFIGKTRLIDNIIFKSVEDSNGNNFT